MDVLKAALWVLSRKFLRYRTYTKVLYILFVLAIFINPSVIGVCFILTYHLLELVEFHSDYHEIKFIELNNNREMPEWMVIDHAKEYLRYYYNEEHHLLPDYIKKELVKKTFTNRF